MNRRSLLILLVLLVAAAAGIWYAVDRAGRPTLDELSPLLDRDLAAWQKALDEHDVFQSELLRPLAEEVKAPVPARRARPGEPVLLLSSREQELGRLGADRAADLNRKGQAVEAVELLRALILYGEDARCERGFDVEFQPTVKAAEAALRDLARDEALSGKALERAIEFERVRLRERPRADEAWRFRYLDTQVNLRRLAGGNEAVSGATDVELTGPVRSLFGLVEAAAKPADYLEGWRRLRSEFEPLLAAAAADDEEKLRGMADGVRESCPDPERSIYGRAASSLLILGDLARDNFESWLRTREARLFGVLMLRHRERTGAFPENLESIRVPEIPKSPHGGTWRLGIDRETKKPGVFLDGGRVYTYQVLAPREGDFHSDRETKPLFSFR